MRVGEQNTILDFNNKKNKNKCCGCHACYNICPQKAISMVEDEKGFKYPIIDKNKCINCGLCKKSCPIEQKRNDIKTLPKAYACINNDLEIRKKSSSGGVFSLLAQEILEKKGVVFGVAFNENFEANHICVHDIEYLSKVYKSKYVQSNINLAYKETREFLENNREVLFTGTPCQIEGLYTFLGKNYDNLYTQDVICHGVPSPKVWNKYKIYLEKKYNSKICNIEFRNKEKGWKNYCIKISFNNGKKYYGYAREDVYLNLFLNDIILRNSCYDCKFKGVHKQSDITLGDFWGVEKFFSELDDDNGTSLVIINSKKGEELLKKIAGKITLKKVELKNVIVYNPSIISNAQKNIYIKNFYKRLEKNNDTFSEYDNNNSKQKILKRVIKKINNRIKKIKINRLIEEKVKK